MKIKFHPQFTDQGNIEYWNSIYDQPGFTGYCYRQRMGTVLSWLEDLGLSENSKILEAGCGAGRLVDEATKRGYRVVGMDYSYGMLLKASSICNHQDELSVAFLQGDIEALPYKDFSFDVIVCLGVVAYLKSEYVALHELARVLKPGGILIISIVNKARLVYRLDLPLLFISIAKKIRTGLTLHKRNSSVIDIDPSLTTYFVPQFKKSIELAGLTVLEIKSVPWKLLTFCGKEVFPQKMAAKITLFFEQFSNIPMVGSFGGMCIFKAGKNSLGNDPIEGVT